MSNTVTCKVSAIISNEKRLEKVIHRLIQHAVARHDISVQGPPNEIANKFGTHYLVPDNIQESANPPKQEAFMNDDFGWLIGFSFSIPVFIGLIIGVFLIGDVRSLHDNILFGFMGGIIGALIGFCLAGYLKKRHSNAVKAQEKKGGYVLWITLTGQDQVEQVVAILNKFHAKNITVT
jgi:hypothetical protein